MDKDPNVTVNCFVHKHTPIAIRRDAQGCVLEIGKANGVSVFIDRTEIERFRAVIQSVVPVPAPLPEPAIS